jgi:competence ComEA-like helix-hairpin-helix protein
VLISIIVVLVVYLNVAEKFVTTGKQDAAKFQKEMDSLYASIKEDPIPDGPNVKEIESNIKTNSTKQSERFNFNPNNLSAEKWARLGLSDKQIRTIKNYEAKGGKFRKKEDLKKMYCIKSDLYESLEPYISIEPLQATFENGEVRSNNSSGNERTPKTSTIIKSATAIIELNSADSAMLTTIKGIGAFYAKTIIKYRNSLGGFCSKEQLMEVWKFDQEKYNLIERYVSVDASKIKKVNINTCEADQLKSPYVRWNVANAIVSYRKQHGAFKTIDDIKKTDLVDDETLRKIAPYLVVE